jgi:hypothetical protein
MFVEMISAFLVEVSNKRIGYRFPHHFTTNRILNFRSLVDGNGSALVEHEIMENVVRDWFKANCLAVAARYPNREPGTSALEAMETEVSKIKFEPFRKPVSLTILLRHLDCLLYQCSEYVGGPQREWFDTINDEIKRVRNSIGCSIVQNSKEYDEGPWGYSTEESTCIDPSTSVNDR